MARNSDYALLTELQALRDQLAAQVAAPQWVAGPQTAGALVFDQGLLYRVKTTVANSQSAPASNPTYYFPLGPVLTADQLTALQTRIANLEAITYGIGLQKVGPLVSLQQPVLPVALDAGQQGGDLNTATGVVTQTQFPTSTVSGFLPVSPGASYTPSRKIDRYAYYDASQAFLGGGTNATVLSTPAAAAFLRVQLPYDTYASTTFAVPRLPYVRGATTAAGPLLPDSAGLLDLTGLAVTQDTAIYTPTGTEEVAFWNSSILSLKQMAGIIAHQLTGTGGGTGGGGTAPTQPTVLAVAYANIGRNVYPSSELPAAFSVVGAEVNSPSLSFKQTASIYAVNPQYAGAYVIDGTTPVGFVLNTAAGEQSKSLANLPGGTTTRTVWFIFPAQQRVNDEGDRLGGAVTEITVPAGYTGRLVSPASASAANTIALVGDSLSNAIGSDVPQRDSYAALIEAQTGWKFWLTGYGYRSWSKSLNTPALVAAEIARLKTVAHTRLYVPLLVNDYYLGVGTPSGTAALAAYFFDEYHKAFPGNLVYTHTMPVVNNNAVVNGYAPADFNDPYSRLIGGRNAWLIMGNGTILYNAPHAADNVHYPTAGYATIATNLVPFLQSQPAPAVSEEGDMTFTPSPSVWVVDSYNATDKTNGQTRYTMTVGATATTKAKICTGADFYANTSTGCGIGQIDFIRTSDKKVAATVNFDFGSSTGPSRKLYSTPVLAQDSYVLRLTNLGGGSINAVAIDGVFFRDYAGEGTPLPDEGTGGGTTPTTPTTTVVTADNFPGQGYDFSQAGRAFAYVSGSYGVFTITAKSTTITLRGIRGNGVLGNVRVRLTNADGTVFGETVFDTSTSPSGVEEDDVPLYDFTNVVVGAVYKMRVSPDTPNKYSTVTGYTT